mmetsp:Transcript_68802/g.143456  ORF Transcript_68802/g.143456 Transcript_68802/m.143456 type:complete len:224 (-) Transcript_68802:333-1004(-)
MLTPAANLTGNRCLREATPHPDRAFQQRPGDTICDVQEGGEERDSEKGTGVERATERNVDVENDSGTSIPVSPSLSSSPSSKPQSPRKNQLAEILEWQKRAKECIEQAQECHEQVQNMLLELDVDSADVDFYIENFEIHRLKTQKERDLEQQGYTELVRQHRAALEMNSQFAKERASNLAEQRSDLAREKMEVSGGAAPPARDGRQGVVPTKKGGAWGSCRRE